MYLKIHNVKGERIVAACDENLIGKVIEDKDGLYMDLDKYRHFYVGEIVTEKKLLEELKNFSSANLVGKKVVAVAVKAGLFSKKEVRYINSIPYIQIYKI